MSTAQLSQEPTSVPPTQPRPGESVPQGEKPRRGISARTIMVILVVLAAIGGAVWKIRSNNATQTTTNSRLSAAADRPQPVLVAPVVQKSMPIYLTALGTVTPYYSVTVKSRVDGQLMSVNVREGQAVRKGQVLAQIDPRPYEAALAQAEGQLVKDQANAKNAEAEAARYTALLEAGVVSKESQQSQVSTAGQAAGSIAADQAAIQAARVNVIYTRITSPIDGVVGLRQVDPGNIVHAADTTGLILVTQLQPITAIFTLPEDQLPEVLRRVRGGQKLAVQAFDRSESTKLADGTVLTLDNQIDATTGTDKVKAVFPNKDGALFPNQFVNVRLILQQRPDALVVPASAVQTGSQGAFVFVVKPGTPPGAPANAGAAGGKGAGGKGSGGRASAPVASQGGNASGGGPGRGNGAGASGGGDGKPYYVVAQPVVVDVQEGSQVILSSGVRPGDQVVIDGQEKLLPNGRVSPRTPAQVPGGARAAAAQTADSQTGGGAEAGTSSAAYGPEGAGPADSRKNPAKRGLEEGHGIHPGANPQDPARRRNQGAPQQP